MPEWEGCEKPVIEELVTRGWEYVPGVQLVREEDEALILRDLREFMEKNMRELGIEMKDEHFSQILLALRGKAGMEGYRETLNIIKDGFVTLDIKGRGLLSVKLIDYENVRNNKFVVSNQVTFITSDGREKRLDVVLFVNGIPIAAIECKNPVGNQTWYDAYRQLKGYEQDLTELYRFVQINVAIGAKARAYATMPWSDDERKTIKWGIGEFDEMGGIVDLLSPETILDVIRNFVFIMEFRGKMIKLMPRFMQYRTANQIYRNVLEHRKGGVIWHWQGSGKTFTMIFAAYKLYTDMRMEKPTVFFVMDRKEIEAQFMEFISGMDFGGKVPVEHIGNIEELEKILRFDGGRGKRGFFVLLIHKFKEKGGIDLEDIEKMGIVDRENILVFVDEAHRTQYGILAARMRRALRNAKFFAFTGTPLLRSDKNTFREFGDIVDRYFIEESVKDGFTVPIVYTFAKEKGIHLDTDSLKKAVAELIKEEEEEVAKRLRPTREFMKGEERMRKIAKNIVEDFLNNRRYKGMVVAVDREACVLYRKHIMEYLKEKYPGIYKEYGERFAEVVMTYNPGKDMDEIEGYRIEIEERYNLNWSDVNKKIREDFKDEEKMPKIVIVTDMLLTGYDVPVLEVMYLDKIMNGHNLLQAIARTNRPYKEKGFGIVVDFVGIFKIFKDTLRKYYAIEDVDVESAALSVDILKRRLDEMMKAICRDYPFICDDAQLLAIADRESLYSALYSIYQCGKQQDFEKRFRELNRIWNALGGDPIKAENKYLTFYRAVSALYILHRRESREPVSADVIKSVKEIHEKIREISGVKSIGRRGEIIIDESFLEEIENKAKVESVVDMTAILNIFVSSVRGNAVKEKIFGDIVEYIESAIERWKERKSTIEEIYLEQKKALEKILAEDRKLKSLEISSVEYAMIKIVSKELGDEEEVARMIHTTIEELIRENLLFADWYKKIDVVKKIREKFRKRILKHMVSHGNYNKEVLDRIVNEIMKILPYLGVKS